MIEICSKIDCTGCRCCEQICPRSAIDMIEDDKGHIYPAINQQNCIDCGLCQKRCPSVNDINRTSSKKAFGGWIKDSASRKISTSGGLSFALSRCIVSNGGYFCGVVWNPEKKCTRHKITDKLQELPEFQGSKYSHSDTSEVFIQIKKLLASGKKVLFSGTPCQVAGLKSFVGRDYNNLYTVDLICHGVPSRRILRDRIDTVEKSRGSRVVNMMSRVKAPNQYLTNTCYYHEDGSVTSINVSKDVYYRCFVENFCLRPNCYHCKYSQENRVSDITLGDFWCYEPHSLKFRSYLAGTSAICVNTEKGKELIDAISEELLLDERSYKEIAANNRNLMMPQVKPHAYDEFWHRYLSGELLDALSKEYFPPIETYVSFNWKVKKVIKMLLPAAIRNILTKK